MNGLYPIIRRVRRPLMPTDVLADPHQADAKPATPETKPVRDEATREDERDKASGE
jgi:hypothetical protein